MGLGVQVRRGWSERSGSIPVSQVSVKVPVVLPKNSRAEAALLCREDARAAPDSHPHILPYPSQQPGEVGGCFPGSTASPLTTYLWGEKGEAERAESAPFLCGASSRQASLRWGGELCFASKVASLTGLDGIFKYQEVTKEVIEFVHSIIKGSLPSRERRSSTAQPEQGGWKITPFPVCTLWSWINYLYLIKGFIFLWLKSNNCIRIVAYCAHQLLV